MPCDAMTWPQVWDLPERAKRARGKVKWLLMNNHTSLGRLGSAALVGLGEGQLRIETHACQVCWTGLTCDQGNGLVLWTFTGRKTLPPFTSLPAMGEIAGANTFHSTKTRARWAEGFHELNGYVFDLERDGLHQVVLCPRLTIRQH